MGKKKKKGYRRAYALSPINKKGIKLGTLLSEVGVVYEAKRNYDSHRDDLATAATSTVQDIINPMTTGGKLFWTGVGIAAIGKFTGFRGFGPIQFS
jgi:hypothetical protein